MSQIPVIMNAVPESDEEELLDLPPVPGSPRAGVAEPVSSVKSGEPRPRVEGTLHLISERNDSVNAGRAASAGRGAAAHATNGAATDTLLGQATSETKHIDIVLIHGLEGDPFSTPPNGVWTKPGSQNVWVRDMLLEKVGPCSLYLYKYETKRMKEAFGRGLNELIRAHAKCLLEVIHKTLSPSRSNIESKLLLMGNGFGGLIAKQALIQAHHEAKDTEEIQRALQQDSPSSLFFESHIAGVVFLGTPHRGWTDVSEFRYYTQATPPSRASPDLREEKYPGVEDPVEEQNAFKGEKRDVAIVEEPDVPTDKGQDALLLEADRLTTQIKEEKRRQKWEQEKDDRTESRYLVKLYGEFLRICEKYEILSVFATKARGPAKGEVGKLSARMDLGNEQILDLEVAPRDLVRYDDQHDVTYKRLQKGIRNMVQKIRNSKDEPEVHFETQYEAPPQLVPERWSRLRRTWSNKKKVENKEKTDEEKKDRIEKYFPLRRDIPVEAFKVRLQLSEQFGSFHDIDEVNGRHLHDISGNDLRPRSGIGDDAGSMHVEEDVLTLTGGFSWVHIPGNDRAWVRDTVLKVQDPLTPLGILSDKYWKDKERNYGNSGRFYLRYMEPSCEICADDVDNPQLVIYLPYLHWSEHQTQQGQAEALQYYHEASDDIKREYEMSKKRSSDMRLRSCALGGELPHHPRRTLDQFYYRNINTQDRDRDQIVLHKTKDPQKVLMVDQLWVVVTSVDTIFTFFPRNHASDESNDFADLRNNIVEKMKETNILCHDAFEMAGLCILHAVNVLLNPPAIRDGDLNVFQLFQLTIEETKELAVKALNGFIAADHSDPDNLSVKKELNLLRTVADMEDELEILRHLFHEQERVIKGFLTVIDEHGINQRHGVTAAKRALTDVREFGEEARRMWVNAHSIREQLSHLLNLKQTTANLEEARGSRTMQNDTAEQGRTMMIFTVFTVVFLPLSFFTSLYGMNLREWTGQETNISARSAALFMGLISALVIAFALIAAFWGKRVKDFFMNRWNGGKKAGGTDVEMQDQWSLMDSRRS